MSKISESKSKNTGPARSDVLALIAPTVEQYLDHQPDAGGSTTATLPVTTLDAVLKVEPFQSDPAWGALHTYRQQAEGCISKDLPGRWIRAIYDTLKEG